MDGPLGQELLDKITASPNAGLIALCRMSAGARSLYTIKRPIRSIEDIKGLKFSVIRNPIFIDMTNAPGGNGVLTIPVFVLAGAIMAEGGMAGRLVMFAVFMLVTHLPTISLRLPQHVLRRTAGCSCKGLTSANVSSLWTCATVSRPTSCSG